MMISLGVLKLELSISSNPTFKSKIKPASTPLVGFFMTYQALPNQLHVKNSPIAGQGIFAKENVPAGHELGMSHIIHNDEIYRTPLGGFINHSDDPNCQKYPKDQFYFIKTIKEIREGEELFLNYTFYKIN